MNVLKELLHSIYKLDSYPVFMRDRKRKTFLFGFLLVFLYFIVTVFVPLMRYPVTPGRFEKLVEEQVPDFTLENQRLTVDREVEYKGPDMYIFVNTDDTYVPDSALSQVLRAYSRVLVMDSEKVVIQNISQGIQRYSYSDLDPDLSFSKTQLLDLVEQYAPMMVLGLAAILLVILIGMEITFFFAVMFIALLGMIVASCVHQDMTFGQLYKLGIYTRTTPLLIKALISFLPIGVPFYFLISIGISLAYMAGALKNIKTPPLTGGPLVFSSDQAGAIDGSDQNHFY